MQSKITQAVILSAGYGTRLRGVTSGTIPIVMIPGAGRPLLERHIEQFKRYGVAEFFINLFYLPDVIRNYFRDGAKWDVKIEYALEPEIRGTAGGLKNFEGRLKGNCFPIYGDLYSEANYRRMADAFAGHSDAIGMELVGDTDHAYDYDLVTVDDQLRFLKIHPKPHKELPNSYKSMLGIYILNERIFKYVPENTYYELDHEILPDILEKGETFYGYESEDLVQNIGTPDRYAAIEKYLKVTTT